MSSSNPTLSEQAARLQIKGSDFGLKEPLVIRDEYRGEDLPGWKAQGIRMPPESFRILSIFIPAAKSQ